MPTLTADTVTASFTQPPQRMLDVGHAQLAYRRFGAGPDLVFVHGWPLTQATWRHLVALLHERFTCHLFDLPGCGQTTWSDDSRLHMPGHAETLADAVDALGIERYGLVAHDSGGGIARELAAAHGERVFGLVLGNTEIPGARFSGMGLFQAATRLAPFRLAFRAALRSRKLSAHRKAMGGCFTDPTYAMGEFYDLQVAPLGESARALEGQLHFVRNFRWAHVDGLAEVHRRMTAPTLLVWGARDHFFPLDDARAMLPQFSGGAELEVIPEGRLFVHEDHAVRFAAWALPFLLRHADAKGASDDADRNPA